MGTERRIGINWGCYGGDLTTDEQIGLMCKNGFTATFLGSEDPMLDEVLPALQKAGIVCESLHAPFSGINRMWSTEEGAEQMLERLKNGVSACARHQVPVLVVHLSSGDHAPVINDIGIHRFTALMEFADAQKVTIAYENQRKLANLALAMELFPQAAFCWDVGHEACFAYGREFMPLFGDRIAAVHLHDNFAEHNGDLHLLPYDGKINMAHAAELLAHSGYSGAVMLEVIRGNSRMYENLSAEDYYRRAADAARRFVAAMETGR